MYQFNEFNDLNYEKNNFPSQSPLEEIYNLELINYFNNISASDESKNEKFNVFIKTQKSFDDIKNKTISKQKTAATDMSQMQNYEKNHTKIQKSSNPSRIFDIGKANNHIGRLSHELKNKDMKVQHDKFSDDNILTKIKVRFLKSLILFINILYSAFKIDNSKLILMIDPSNSRNIKRKDVLNWFNQKVKDALSCNISPKYKRYKTNANKIRIRHFYEKEKNNPKLLQILEMKIREIYEIYIQDEKEEGFEQFNNFNDDTKKLENEMYLKNEEKIKEYLELYQKYGKNLETKFAAKAIRNYDKHKED